jgi:mRNA-degrading endonuclease toxin of MazEF toxin-antitoxin module
MIKRGDVVLVDYPFTRGGAKTRPALIVQNDRENARLTNTIVAQITSNTSRVHEATQYSLEPSEEPGSGLLRTSALNASNLLTMNQRDILRVLGSLSPATMSRIDECLKAAPELS